MCWRCALSSDQPALCANPSQASCTTAQRPAIGGKRSADPAPDGLDWRVHRPRSPLARKWPCRSQERTLAFRPSKIEIEALRSNGERSKESTGTEWQHVIKRRVSFIIKIMISDCRYERLSLMASHRCIIPNTSLLCLSQIPILIFHAH